MGFKKLILRLNSKRKKIIINGMLVELTLAILNKEGTQNERNF